MHVKHYKERLRDMDDEGVDVQVVSLASPAYPPSYYASDSDRELICHGNAEGIFNLK